MRSILREGRAFPALQSDIGKPLFGCCGDRDAVARRCVYAPANVNPDSCVICVGVLFLIEGVNMRTAGLVVIMDDPRLALFAPSCCPRAFANRPCRSPLTTQ